MRDEDIANLIDLAIAGIHPPDEMPFYVPWSTRPPGELAVQQRFRLEPQDLDRSGVELDVTGVGAFRRFIGLDE